MSKLVRIRPFLKSPVCENLPLIVVFLLLSCGISLAQMAPASLEGTVIDTSGAIYAGASITLTEPATGISLSAVSDAEGKFIFPHLRPGIYDLRVDSKGFKTQEIKGIRVTIDQSNHVEVKLSSGDGTLGKGGPEGEVTFNEPVWNVWSEKYQSDIPNFQPVQMQQDKTYLVTVDLAALRYDKYSASAYSHEVTPEFDDWLHSNTDNFATLKVLAIGDDRFFQRSDSGNTVQKLKIDLTALRKALQEGFSLDGSPFKFLANHGGKAPFSFGEVSFVFTTKKHVKGNASIAFSFWVDGMPITELTYSPCIRNKASDTCEATKPTPYSLKGVDATSHGHLPDAALHLIELAPDNLIGVYRCNSCNGWKEDEFKTWRLGRGAAWFQEQFDKTVLPGIKLAANGSDPQDPSFNEATFNNAGEALYNLVFHSADPPPVDAEVAFRSFVSQRITNEDSNKIAPTIFVRLLPQQPDLAFMVPFGMARVAFAQGKSEFLGFHFRIQSPLELQDYSTAQTCLSKWILLVPPHQLGEPSLAAARAQFADWIDIFHADHSNAEVYEDVGKFKEWVQPDAETVSGDRETLLILSHHKQNSLYFSEDDPSLFASNVQRSFGKPSLALIDACGTANPGAFEFVRELNLHGVQSVVASAVDVNARMGGVFLNILFNELSQHPERSIDWSMLNAIKSLRMENDGLGDPPRAYGPRALLFQLIGNGSLKLCLPAKAP